MRALLAFAACFLAACTARIPEGRLSCNRAEDCPAGFACFADTRGQHCYSHEPTQNGANPATEHGDATLGSLRTVGQRRSGGQLTVYDDGFEVGARTCSADRSVCVAGGLEP